MQWDIWPLGMLWKVVGVRNWRVSAKRAEKGKERRSRAASRLPIRTSFYSTIPTLKIRSYQKYLDCLFELNPSMEFESEDARLDRLLEEAETLGGLSKLDLEVMRMQYVLADKRLRRDYRRMWAVTVIHFEETGFFPSPWDILSAVFDPCFLGACRRTPIFALVDRF